MGKMTVQFLGSGDAFGSGGRLQPCILVKTAKTQFLVDCGTTCMISMRRYGINPNDISMIVLSHLHGDHFCGIPFFIIDAQVVSKRTAPLKIVGPIGTKKRVKESMEVDFPGSTKVERKHAIEFVEIEAGKDYLLNGVKISAQLGSHPSGADSLITRYQVDNTVLAYTGDTEWTDNLLLAAKDADLLISECYYYSKKVKNHLDFQVLQEKKDQLGAKRIVLTHMSADMLANLEAIDWEYADDGKVFEL